MRTSKIATVLSSLSGIFLCGANFMLERTFLRVVAVGSGQANGIFLSRAFQEKFYGTDTSLRRGVVSTGDAGATQPTTSSARFSLRGREPTPMLLSSARSPVE
jgi:hypothetical protein